MLQLVANQLTILTNKRAANEPKSKENIASAPAVASRQINRMISEDRSWTSKLFEWWNA
jgi:hypothetical protein